MPDTSERYTLLKAMHTIVCLMNDESAYMRWISIIPDCASEDELRDCASDDEILQDVCQTFTELIKAYGKSGGYYADKKVFG